MKRKFKSLIINILAFYIIISVSPLNAYASNTVEKQDVEAEYNGETSIVLFGNITGYKYKIWEGKQWKRLWSYTYNKWVDPYWTLA